MNTDKTPPGSFRMPEPSGIEGDENLPDDAAALRELDELLKKDTKPLRQSMSVLEDWGPEEEPAAAKAHSAPVKQDSPAEAIASTKVSGTAAAPTEKQEVPTRKTFLGALANGAGAFGAAIKGLVLQGKDAFIKTIYKQQFQSLQSNFKGDELSRTGSPSKREMLVRLTGILEKSPKCVLLTQAQCSSLKQYFEESKNEELLKNNDYKESREKAEALFEKLTQSGSLSESDVKELIIELKSLKDLEAIHSWFDGNRFNPSKDTQTTLNFQQRAVSDAVQALSSNLRLTPEQIASFTQYTNDVIAQSKSSLEEQVQQLREYTHGQKAQEEKELIDKISAARKNTPQEVDGLRQQLAQLREKRADLVAVIRRNSNAVIEKIFNPVQSFNALTQAQMHIAEPHYFEQVSQNLLADAVGRRIAQDISRANSSVTQEQMQAKLQKAQERANSVENLTEKVHDVSFAEASDKTLFKHARRSGATPDKTETIPLASSGYVAGCTSLTNFKNQNSQECTNEDRYLAMEMSVTLEGQTLTFPVFGIFDGHGEQGHRGSEFVAQRLPGFLQQQLQRYPAPLSDENIFNALREAFVACNDQFNKEFPGALYGSTAVLSVVLNGALWVANAGDSRAMLAHPDGTATALSADATPGDEKLAWQIEKREGRVSDNRLKAGDATLATAGAFGDFRFMGVSAVPKITRTPLADVPAGTKLILACDGLFDVANAGEVSQAVRAMAGKKPHEIAQTLASRARNATHSKAAGNTVSEEKITNVSNRLAKFIRNMNTIGDLQELFKYQVKNLTENSDKHALIEAIARGAKELPWAQDATQAAAIDSWLESLRKSYPLEKPQQTIGEQIRSFPSKLASLVKRTNASPVNKDDITVIVCDLSS